MLKIKSEKIKNKVKKDHIRNFLYCAFSFLVFLINSSTVSAQVFPVQVNAFMRSPYSSKLSDYATSMDTKFTVQLIPIDMNMFNRRVNIKMYIEGSSIKVMTTPYVATMPIYLTAGMPVTLTNLDLANHFRLQNLMGISPQQYANPLPEGMYKLCFEVFDAITNLRLSRKTCANFYLMLNEPPLLNIPVRGEQITATDFPNIIFTWTPRQANATNVSYVFQLKEIIDPKIDPQIGFLMAPLLYEENLYSTTLLYDLGKPTLIPGKRYAWRVKAISKSGLSENAVFKNDGYSEIFHFKYATDCTPPLFAFSEVQSTQKAKISWQGDPKQLKYHLQYRKKGVKRAYWFDLYTKNTQALLYPLEAGVSYEFRVGAACDNSLPNQQEYTYSGIKYFTMPEENASLPVINCGINPEIKITNKKPITNLVVSETFTANDFPVKILELQGSNGIYSGKGYIVVPYLADSKITVVFNRIKINTDYQLIEGVVETTYDPVWGNVANTGELTGEGAQGRVEVIVDFPIRSIEKGADGSIIITGANGEQISKPGGKDMVITDSKGNIYAVDEEGTITGPMESAPGGKPTPENTDGVNKDGTANAITAKGITVHFEDLPEALYAFDPYPEKATTEIQKEYTKVEKSYLPFKAVEKGKKDVLRAVVTVTDTKINTDSLVFKTQSGALVPAVKNGNGSYTLTVSGTLSYAQEQVLAVIPQGGKYQTAGAFNLVHISPKSINVIVVPYGNAKIPTETKKMLEQTYAKAAVTVRVSQESALPIINLGFDRMIVGESDFLEHYNEDQKAINKQLKNRPGYQSDAYYILFTDLEPSVSGTKGFMALQGQFAYVFTKNYDPKTAAHELAHGAFALEHPFKKDTDKGKTNWLMDYNNGTVLSHRDWKQINDPKLKLYWFQKESEGEYDKTVHFGLTPDGTAFDEFYFTDHDKTYLTVTSLVAKDNYVIQSIEYENNKYIWDTTSKAYINGSKKIKVKKTKTGIDKVNVLRSISNCYYEYLVVSWTPEDEKEKDVTGLLQSKIEKSTGIWVTNHFTIRDSSCELDFLKNLKKLNSNCTGEEIAKGEKTLKENINTKDTAALVDIVNSVCLESIRNMGATTILSFFNTIQQQKTIKEKSEIALLRLMNALPSDNYKEFFAYLEKENNKVLKHLVEEIDDSSVYFWIDKDNYTNFIGGLVSMYNQNPESIADRWPTTDDFAARMINLNPVDYSSDHSSVFYQNYMSKHNNGEYNDSTGLISLYDIYTLYHYNPFDTHGSGVTKTENKDKLADVSPLTPIIIVPNKDKIPLIASAIDGYDFGNNYYIVPAIFLKYNSDKIRNDYVEKGIITTLDVTTIAVSGGTALATKVHWVHRAWALAEIAGAIGNIAVNTETINPNSDLGKAIHAYNIGMGIIGVKNVAVGGYKFIAELPATTKTLLQQNKGLRNLLVSQYLNYRIAITKLKNSDQWNNLSAEVRQSIVQQEKAFITLADAKNIPNDKWGTPLSAFISGKTSEDILSIPKGSRPDPKTYLKSGYISDHLAKFDDGIVRFTSRVAFEKYGTLGPDGGFVLPKKYLDDILSDANGNMRIIEKKLGFENNYLNDKDIMIVFIKKNDFSELQIPSGNEGGVNPLWIPGGFTSGNIPEAVMNFSTKPKFIEIKLK